MTGPRLLESLLANLPLKVASLAFSLGFFAFLHGAQNAHRSFEVPVLYYLPPEETGSTLLALPPDRVRVHLTGGKALLDEIRADDLGSVQLDLRRGNSTYITFDPSQLSVPPGLLVTIDPPGVELEWDTILSRDVPIQLSLAGEPQRGLAVDGPPTADPPTVRARGPRTIVEALQHARVEPFDIAGLTEGTHHRKLQLDPPASRVRYSAQSTVVTVHIVRARLERVYGKIPVQVLGPQRPTVVPAEVDVQVSGPPELVNELRREQLVPIVDARAAAGESKSGTIELPVVVRVDGCTTRVTPASAFVKW